jgi:CheY-like chemotaxis protein
MSDSLSPGPVSEEAVQPLIFVVDDEPMIGTIIELTLQMRQYRTSVFKDPAMALEAFIEAETKPDMLVTDYNMPGMTGIDLIRVCKESHPAMKTVLLSGTVDESFLRTLQPQPDIFIAKPFFPQELLDTVKRLLAG